MFNFFILTFIIFVLIVTFVLFTTLGFKKVWERKWGKRIMILIGIILGIWLIWLFSNPLRWPTHAIRLWVLSSTPRGMHITEVLEYIEEHPEWPIATGFVNDIHRFYGFYNEEDLPALTQRGVNARSGNILSGNRSRDEIPEGIYREFISIKAGSYYILVERLIWVRWMFDEDGYLLDVLIRREIAFP